MGWVLAIDFGTVVTAAAVMDVGASGRPVAVEVDQSWRVPSGVVRLDDGQLVVGRMALNQAALRIEAFEATPKRRMGEGVLNLGGPVPVVDAIAAVLRVMVAEARRMKGGSQPEVVCLTHPATWAATRLSALREAAAVAGVPDVVLLAEPVAAACWYAAMSGMVPAGGRVAVYDLGGGTFDAAVVESVGDGSFVTVGRPVGVDPLGGLDFDHALLGLVGQTIERRDPQLWASLQRPADTRARRRRRALLEQVRLLKEDLSTISQSTLLVPETELEVTVTREQFAGLIRADVERSAQVLLEAIEAAQLRPDQLAAVYLVGGSSRIPVVEQIVAERLGRSPATMDEPKQVVAFGAALDTARRVPAVAPAPTPEPIPNRDQPPPAPPAPPPVPGRVAGTGPHRSGRFVALLTVAIIAVIGAVVTAVVLASSQDGPSAGPSHKTSDSPSSCPAGESRDAAGVCTSPSSGPITSDPPTCPSGEVLDSTGTCAVPSDPPGSGLSAAEQELVDRLPTSLVDVTSCTPYTDGEGTGVPAVVSCSSSATAPDVGVPPDTIFISQATDSAAMAAALTAEFGTLPANGAVDCSSAETFPWSTNGGPRLGDVYCGYFANSDLSAFDWTYDSDAVIVEAVAKGKFTATGRVTAGLKLWWDALSADQVTLR